MLARLGTRMADAVSALNEGARWIPALVEEALRPSAEGFSLYAVARFPERRYANLLYLRLVRRSQ